MPVSELPQDYAEFIITAYSTYHDMQQSLQRVGQGVQSLLQTVSEQGLTITLTPDDWQTALMIPTVAKLATLSGTDADAVTTLIGELHELTFTSPAHQIATSLIALSTMQTMTETFYKESMEAINRGLPIVFPSDE